MCLCGCRRRLNPVCRWLAVVGAVLVVGAVAVVARVFGVVVGAGPVVRVSARRRTAPTSGPSFDSLAHIAARLTERDRTLLVALASQRVLTTPLLTEIGFNDENTARHRLAKLVTEARVVRRFRPLAAIGSHPWHYVLTPLGAHLVAVLTGTAPEAARSRARRDADLAVMAGSAKLAHTLGTNAFYTSLVKAARTSAGQAELTWWRSERDLNAERHQLIAPDGSGIWRAHTRTAAGQEVITELPFVLEYDTGTEKHEVLTDKLDRYRRVLFSRQWSSLRAPMFNLQGIDELASGATTVLFVFATPGREMNVRTSLIRYRAEQPKTLSGETLPRVATAVHTPGLDAAGPIWQRLPESGQRPDAARLPLAHLGVIVAEPVPEPAPPPDPEAEARYQRKQEAYFDLDVEIDDDAEAA